MLSPRIRWRGGGVSVTRGGLSHYTDSRWWYGSLLYGCVLYDGFMQTGGAKCDHRLRV